MATTKKMIRKRSKRNIDAQEEFPGYSKYDASEDIFLKADRVDKNFEGDKLSILDLNPKEIKTTDAEVDPALTDSEDAYELVNPSDVTNEDLQALGPKDLSMDMGDDEQLKNRTTPVDFSASDLDIPGTEDNDVQEEIGSEDEENNSYSLGGDSKDNLEERND
jgi:hypothetical protein